MRVLDDAEWLLLRGMFDWNKYKALTDDTNRVLDSSLYDQFKPYVVRKDDFNETQSWLSSQDLNGIRDIRQEACIYDVDLRQFPWSSHFTGENSWIKLTNHKGDSLNTPVRTTTQQYDRSGSGSDFDRGTTINLYLPNSTLALDMN